MQDAKGEETQGQTDQQADTDTLEQQQHIHGDDATRQRQRKRPATREYFKLEPVIPAWRQEALQQAIQVRKIYEMHLVTYMTLF